MLGRRAGRVLIGMVTVAGCVLAGCTAVVPGVAAPSAGPAAPTRPVPPPVLTYPLSLAELAGQPCAGLSRAQATGLDVRPVGSPSLRGEAPTKVCEWGGATRQIVFEPRPGVDDVADTVENALGATGIQVAGRPGAQIAFAHVCAVMVSVEGGSILTGARDTALQPDPADCATAVRFTEVVVGNLRPG